MNTRRILEVTFVVTLVVLAAFAPIVSATPGDPPQRSAETAPSFPPGPPPTIPPGPPPTIPPGPPPTIPPPPAPRPVKVRLTGTIISMVDGIWTLDTLTGPVQVTVDGSTRIVEALGEAEVGAHIWVIALVMPDASLLAQVIVVREPRREQGEPFHFSGEINSLPEGGLEGLWSVGAYEELLVTERTIILPEGVEPEEGDWARVNAFRESDGSIWAKKITIIATSGDGIKVDFTGVIQECPDGPPYEGDWVICNIDVTSDEHTEVIGTPEVGLLAKVKAILWPNGDLIATMIEIREVRLKPIKFRGIIHEFPSGPSFIGYWVIGVVDVVADGDTEITGIPATGLLARVEGIPQADGTVLATVITVEGTPPWPVETEFDGTIERLPKRWQHGVWLVSGQQVLVKSRTEVTGEPVVGKAVHVRGTRTGGVVHASEIFVY